MEILGKPSTNKLLFYLGKLAIVGNIIFIFLKGRVQPLYEFNLEVQMLSLILLFLAGGIVFVVSLINLGDSLRVGLPTEQTRLKTHGLFAVTRNPIYLGVYLLCTASCIFTFHWLNIVLLFVVVFTHHQIILGEEKFLEQRFGQEWIQYKSRVRRYL